MVVTYREAKQYQYDNLSDLIENLSLFLIIKLIHSLLVKFKVAARGEDKLYPSRCHLLLMVKQITKDWEFRQPSGA
jgi:hypothetical protein